MISAFLEKMVSLAAKLREVMLPRKNLHSDWDSISIADETGIRLEFVLQSLDNNVGDLSVGHSCSEPLSSFGHSCSGPLSSFGHSCSGPLSSFGHSCSGPSFLLH